MIIFYKLKQCNALSKITMFDRIIKGRTINFQISLKNIELNKKIKFYFSYMNNTIEIFPIFDLHFHVPPIINGYYLKGDYTLINDGKRLTLQKNLEGLLDKLEDNYCNKLKIIGKNKLIQFRKEAKEYFKKPKKKEIWLINDRVNKAGDNGEFFFRYLNLKNPKDINFNFVISKYSSDYKRLKKLGNVLCLSSKEYKQTFLKADKIISSVSNSWIDNAFGKNRKYLIDLYHFDLIFLQHGISKDDVSNLLHRFFKNFSMIITASKYEYKSFLSPNYGYENKNIKLTGFSRFDNLYINEKINNTIK